MAFESLPSRAAVDRLIDPATRAADAGFARSHIDHIVVGIRDRDAADGRGALLVEDGLPHTPTIGRLPHTAGNRAKVIDIGLAGDASHCQHASAAEGADVAPAHSA